MLHRKVRFPGSWQPRRQPQGDVAANAAKYPHLRHLFWPRTLQDLVTGSKLNDTGAHRPGLTAGIGGLAMDFTPTVGGTPILSRPTTVPPVVGWTIEMLVSFSSYFGDYSLCRHDQTNSMSGGMAGTYDRDIQMTSGNQMRAYIFDGGVKYATNTASISLNTLYHVAATCTASSLICYVDGVGSSATAVGNSGFTGFSGVFFLLGMHNIHRVPFCAVHGRPLTAGEIAHRAAHPYDILIPAG
jgi:hypothetical protein